MFILTGCNAEYNLIYEDNILKENLKVTSNKEESFINEINNYYSRDFIINYKLDIGDMSDSEYVSEPRVGCIGRRALTYIRARVLRCSVVSDSLQPQGL